MDKETTIIICPECGTEINVNQVLYLQLENQIKKDYEKKSAIRDMELESKLEKFESERKSFAEEKKKQNELVEKEVNDILKSEKTILEKVIREKIDEEKSGELKTLVSELELKSEKLKEFNKISAELSRVQREKEELRDIIIAEQEKNFTELLGKEKEKIKAVETEKSKTELQKREKLIDDLNKRLEEAQNKLEQGSNKLTGEVKEIELRDLLRSCFTVDEITDVPSGLTGADVLHIIKNTVGQVCGKILYERKQTLRFDDKWISKLKEDGLSSKADICVIVTRSMPKDCEETHFRDGVWICNASDIKTIVLLLRDGLMKQYSAITSQIDKGTKMEILYDYLRSNDFQNHIIGILDAFKKMDKALLKERDEALKKFAEREAHIFQAKKSLTSFWGRIDGIAIDSIGREVKMLDISKKDQLN